MDTDTSMPLSRGRRRSRSRTAAGRMARRPDELGTTGWKHVLVRVKDEVERDRVGLMAGGVSFYAMLAIVPSLVAAVTLWGLVSDPARIRDTIDGFAQVLPAGAADLITEQVTRIAESESRTLNWVLAGSLAAALWSASSGVKGLMNAINAAYDEDETRGFLKLRGTALVLTVAAILFALVTVALVVVVPAVLGAIPLPDPWSEVVRFGRWPLLAAAVMVALAVLYRYAPDRSDAKWVWAGPGSVVATVLWLLASIGLSWYAANLGNFQETYGSLAGVVVLMLWFFLSAFAVLLGAELNAEAERQTARDSTTGRPRPRGQRGAYVADTLPEDREP